MKVVIIAGGFGTRLIEETKLIPKPMIQIGQMPIIWHIMKIYSFYGHKEFIICLGNKGHIIREFFINSLPYYNDINIDLKNNKLSFLTKLKEDWKVNLVDTGLSTNTGGRLKKIQKFIEHDENFLFTYGDGLINANINDIIKFHLKTKKLATITAVRPPKRFGVIEFNNNLVSNFEEKPHDEGGWINGGYFVLSNKIFKHIKNYKSIFEKETIPQLVKNNQLVGYKHKDFWHPLDTLRDKIHLEKLWNTNKSPWKKW